MVRRGAEGPEGNVLGGQVLKMRCAGHRGSLAPKPHGWKPGYVETRAGEKRGR